MAGSTKVAILATLMYALLLSSSMVEAARPIVSEGSAVAADGSVMTRDPHSRQLRFFFFSRCWFWGCYRPYYHYPVKGYGYGYDHHDRRLMSTGNGRQLKTFWYGWRKWYKSFYFWHWWY